LGGNASGARSTAIGNTSQASAADAVAVGANNIVSGASASALGVGNTVSGTGSSAVGQINTVNAVPVAAVAIGYGNVINSSAVCAIATGRHGKATFPAELAHGFGSWAGTGESMFRVVSQVAKTTNNAATPLTTGVNAGGSLTLENNRAWYFELTLIAVVTSGSAGEIGLTASWKVNGMIVNDAGTTSIHGTTYYLDNTGSYTNVSTPRHDGVTGGGTIIGSPSITVAASGGALLVTVTGVDRNLSWSGHVILHQVGW
jgi:hypothetical protein